MPAVADREPELFAPRLRGAPPGLRILILDHQPPSSRCTRNSCSMDSNSASYAPFGRTATSRDAPNPLRPYYIPPSIGVPPEAPNNNSPSNPYTSIPASGPSRPASSKHDFRGLFSEMDYGDYISDKGEGVGEMAKRLMDQAIWNYASVFLAQPFEVAKIVLQCHDAGVQTPQVVPVTPSASQRRIQNGYEDVRVIDVRRTTADEGFEVLID